MSETDSCTQESTGRKRVAGAAKGVRKTGKKMFSRKKLAAKKE
jgi:hypothetical protein